MDGPELIIKGGDVPECNSPRAIDLEREDSEQLDGRHFKNEVIQGLTLGELTAEVGDHNRCLDKGDKNGEKV